MDELTRAGWRHFDCECCGQRWWETTRDRFSPSGEDCTCCNTWVHPDSQKEYPPVRTGASGNVLEHEVVMMKFGVEVNGHG